MLIVLLLAYIDGTVPIRADAHVLSRSGLNKEIIFNGTGAARSVEEDLFAAFVDNIDSLSSHCDSKCGDESSVFGKMKHCRCKGKLDRDVKVCSKNDEGLNRTSPRLL